MSIGESSSPWPRICGEAPELEHALVRQLLEPRHGALGVRRRSADRVVAHEREAVARNLADQLGELHPEQTARRCRARRGPARSPGRRDRRARAAAAPRARRRASPRPGTRARSAAARPGRGAAGRSRASRRPGSSWRARRRRPRAGSAARRRTATRCRAAARSRSRSAAVWRATRSAVRCRVPVSADAIVGSGISCTFAWTMRLAPASSMIAPSIFASSYRYCGVNGRSIFMPPENMNCSSLVSPSTISAPRWPLITFSIATRSSVPGAMRRSASSSDGSRRRSDPM